MENTCCSRSTVADAYQSEKLMRHERVSVMTSVDSLVSTRSFSSDERDDANDDGIDFLVKSGCYDSDLAMADKRSADGHAVQKEPSL